MIIGLSKWSLMYQYMLTHIGLCRVCVGRVQENPSTLRRTRIIITFCPLLEPLCVFPVSFPPAVPTSVFQTMRSAKFPYWGSGVRHGVSRHGPKGG